VSLYVSKGLLEENELPIILSDTISIEETLRHFYYNRNDYLDKSANGPKYVAKHHSLEAIGELFSDVIQDLKR
jgi:hypothetical protein